MDEQIEPQAEKPKTSVIIAIIDWIKQSYERMAIVGLILIAMISSIFWITKNKEPELITNLRATTTELRNCTNDDIITGRVQLDDKIMKATIIKLNVYNKFSKGFEKSRENEIKINDGTFRFSFCKATSEYIEFEVTTMKDYHAKQCKVDSIPSIIEF